MKCPRCRILTSTLVVDSRETVKHTLPRRRRECQTCGHRFRTYETIEDPAVIVNDHRTRVGRQEDLAAAIQQLINAGHCIDEIRRERQEMTTLGGPTTFMYSYTIHSRTAEVD